MRKVTFYISNERLQEIIEALPKIDNMLDRVELRGAVCSKEWNEEIETIADFAVLKACIETALVEKI